MPNMLSLHTPLTEISTLSKDHRDALKKLGLLTVQDLLFYFPFRYSDDHKEMSLAQGSVGELVTFYGILEKVKVRRSFKGHIPMTEAVLADNSGTLRLVWFNQAYIGKMYGEGSKVKISGVLKSDSKGFLLSNPHIEKAPDVTPHLEESLFGENSSSEEKKDEGLLLPVYKETKGLTSNFLYHLIKRAVEQGALMGVIDPLPSFIVEELSLPMLTDALLYIHFPKNKELTIAARKRFAFQEIFLMKLLAEKERAKLKNSPAFPILGKEHVETFLQNSSFPPTKAQENAIKTILEDIACVEPMGRLLEGDVGSGKTFVAGAVIAATLGTVNTENKIPLQVAYMAPTEILAKQHFDSFCDYFKESNLSLGLLTSSTCKKFPSKTNKDEGTKVSKRQLSIWLEKGEVSFVVGTHALIQKSVAFKQLALIIIDEQHRFGVRQRKKLAEKGQEERKLSKAKIPHLLSMSATPIPRTLALTMFGDLDLSVLDEMPKGRMPIETKLVRTQKEKMLMHEHMRSEMKAGRQIYVICPRIEKNEEDGKAKNLRSVEEEAVYLGEEIFPEFVIDSIHGKMKADEKDEIMQDFLEKKYHLLVATSVIEVGVNVPNASVILIEGADRFGLAQLHQLRGRVGRGSYQSYCYLLSESTSEKTEKRLASLVTAKNGFELAEIDMRERGIGALIDGKQWGISDIAMEALKNPKLVELAGSYAKTLIKEDEMLALYPGLLSLVEEREKVHME
jgi:ATP-dependent DNA helicase RecG